MLPAVFGTFEEFRAKMLKNFDSYVTSSSADAETKEFMRNWWDMLLPGLWSFVTSAAEGGVRLERARVVGWLCDLATDALERGTLVRAQVFKSYAEQLVNSFDRTKPHAPDFTIN
jgi:hypothetical protein